MIMATHILKIPGMELTHKTTYQIILIGNKLHITLDKIAIKIKRQGISCAIVHCPKEDYTIEMLKGLIMGLGK